MKAIKVSVAQLTPKLGDKQHNLQLISDAMIEAKGDRADLIVFPELFLTGYSVGDDLDRMAETEEGQGMTEIKKLCVEHGLYAVISFPEKGESGQFYISSALIDNNGDVLGIYRKTHLFDKEKVHFTPGSEFKVIETPIGKMGLMICFDVEFPEIARSLKLQGADFIVIVNANMYPYELHHHLFSRVRAMENEIPVIICNRLGVEGDLEFCGDSMVIDATGNILLEMKQAVGVRTVDMPIEQQLDPKMSYTANRRAELYSKLAKH
ncbi:MAG TPA: carbon-nitrogen hydrolase family protein [Bacillus bacterium]|uniref:Carbon-nitrogen hydrolase n=1 Tax=Siminovitchia fordii TaxID=254759 RepID=A0ABQ4K668_9BACI|nr:carbon-nitrogen hydrolase family protein [Siminovitchia fordii]GIN20685.1 carbon-nitrogen hydrolase [Siminovitchia fordii]HBZ08694.1 carbon-nitrogen hydrolase family protein [Bacillus sp. (in: firmicutes)]